MSKVTLQDIADAVGVSRMTVSNAFNRPQKLSTSLRATILDTATELGYAGPDPSARALARGRSGTVGLLLTDSLGEAFRDPVSTEFLVAVGDALAAQPLLWNRTVTPTPPWKGVWRGTGHYRAAACHPPTRHGVGGFG